MRHPALLAIAAPFFAIAALTTCISTARAQQQPALLTGAPVATTAPQEPAAPADTKPATPAGEPAVQPPAEPSAENPAAQAGDPDFRAALDGAVPVEPAAYSTEPYRLRLHNLHTLENIDIVYRIGDTYQPEAVARLNYFLRDHYTNDVVNYNPREFDLLHDILIRLRRPGATIDVVCGYRTQETNEILRASSRGVAEHSQHILGHAIDIRVPGSTTARLRNAALSLNEGGVGYYPTTHFVHVDVGAIRTWTYAPHRRHSRAKAHHRQIAARRHHTTRADGM
ncbi:MAG TPA: DUF882 domain-containing protein [Acidobacteriaceae bacterium]